MVVHKSVLKRARQNEKRRLRNAAIKSTIKTYCKKVREAKDPEIAKELLKVACKLLDKAVTKGVIHKNNAARRKSRLTLTVNKLLASYNSG